VAIINKMGDPKPIISATLCIRIEPPEKKPIPILIPQARDAAATPIPTDSL
jgi:hypothetical protein